MVSNFTEIPLNITLDKGIFVKPNYVRGDDLSNMLPSARIYSKNMKKIILIIGCIFNLIAVAQTQALTLASIDKNIVGYWRKISDGNPTGFVKEKKEIVLVFKSDKTIIYYQNKERLGWGTYSIDSVILLKLNTVMHKNNLLLPNPYDIIGIGGYIMQLDSDNFIFGASALDGTDAVYKRMTVNQIDNFLGKKELSKAFKRKSEKRLLAYFKEWQQMEPTIQAGTQDNLLNNYQKEAYTLFGTFHSERLETVKGNQYTIIDIVLNTVGVADFDIPNHAAIDSFIHNNIQFRDLRSRATSEEQYQNFINEHVPKAYLMNKFQTADIQKYKLDNFMPYYEKSNPVTYLNMRADRSLVLQNCMKQGDKKYKNWYFIKKFLCSGGGVQYDIRDTPTITSIVFNKEANLAFVQYEYSYNYVIDLYQKIGNKWTLHSNLVHYIE